MSNEPNLKEIERRTYMSYYQDGLLDIFIGAFFLATGLAFFISRVWEFGVKIVPWIPAIYMCILWPTWLVAKTKITMPRIGYVNIWKKVMKKLVVLILGTAAAVVCAFIAFVSVRALDIMTQNGLLIFGIGSLVFFIFFGHTLSLKRLYGYGLMALIAFTLGQFLSILPEYIWFALGIMIMVKGFALLIAFVRKYPPLQGGKSVAE